MKDDELYALHLTGEHDGYAELLERHNARLIKYLLAKLISGPLKS